MKYRVPQGLVLGPMTDLWISSTIQRHQPCQDSFFGVHQHVISIRSRPGQSVLAILVFTLVSSVRDLGVHIDSDITLRSPGSAEIVDIKSGIGSDPFFRGPFELGVMSSQPFECLSRLCITFGVSGVLCHFKLCWLIWALVISKVDYCNSILVGVSGHLLDRLQSVLNATARLVFFGHAIRPCQSTTPHATLAASSRTYSVSSLRPGIGLPLPEWTVPYYLADGLRRATDVDADCRCLRSVDMSTLFVLSTCNLSINPGWPCIPSGGFQGMEQFATLCPVCDNTVRLSSRAPDIFVSVKFQLTLPPSLNH